MKSRHIAFFALILLSLQAFADKKMTIRNTDTGESYEVTVPDGLKIYEYNSEWLDSVPYLMERVRYGEPWAYEALGDCYRYGKGGVERSIFKSLTYYDLSDADVDQKAKDAITENPVDILGMTYKLFTKLEQGDNDGVLCLLDSMNSVGYSEANEIRNFICEADTNAIAQRVERNIMSSDTPIDKVIFTLFGCYARNWFPESLKEKDGIVIAIGNKLPYVYDRLAVRFFNDNKEDMDSVIRAKKSAKAITFLEMADKEAMLSRDGASILYKHYQSEMEAGRMDQDIDNIERLAVLARLPESDEFISLTNR